MSFEDDNSDPKEFTESSLKYGDSDLSSKRRKSECDLSENDFDDYINFEAAALDCGLNSTLVEKHCNAFKVKVKNKDKGGGLLKGTLSSILTGDIFFSKHPSDTSRGFKNTFSILENQIATSRKRRKILQPISEEYEPELSVSETDKCTTISNSVKDETIKPDMFELELEARERIKTFLLSQPIKTSDSVALKTPTHITSPINEMLYGITPIGFENNQVIATAAVGEEKVHEQFCDHPEYVYHISKGKDGKKSLRVVRHLLLDKVLCGNRVSQMTRAYDDIEAVTRLLEEKEKDLELTVQIGKELLTQNNRLENRIAELEVELKSSNEDRSQLVHDLHKKTELISILTNDVDDSSDNETPTYSKSITLELMQKKIATLQDENKSLKVEVTQISKQTDEVEEQERKLMEDITMQLNSTNSQFDNISLELERQREENRLQHEQIISLTARLAEAEMRLHQLTQENDEQSSLLGITKENQNLLAIELTEFKTRYQEVLGLLQEAQDQLRKQRKKIQPNGRSSYIPGLSGYGPVESLQTELMESSMYSENSLDSGISTDRMSASGGIMSNVPDIGGVIPPYKKVFETVRCAGKNGHYSDGMSQLGAMSLSSTSGPRMSAMPYMATGLSSNPAGSYHHRTSSMYSGSSYTSYESSMGNKTMSCESLASQSDDGYPSQPSGVPGVPGAKDLEAALKRLTPAEVLARRAMLSYAPAGTYTYDDNPPILPLGIRTPDSIMSTGSSGGASSTNQWRLPEKLQIVKPMEGSQTLHHWSRLATPTLSGLLEERPGVTIRGGRGLDELGMQVYSLSDVEEDVEDLPGKQFQESGYVYTYTNSFVMHPDDGLMNDLSFLSQSQLSSRMASASTSRQPSCPATPIGRSRKNSCSTYSVNMGLASMLNERGIKAITPSALNTPAGPNFTPTVTPCNSPEGTPSRSNSPEPMFGIFSTGADMIRRKLIGEVERPTRSHSTHQKIMLSRLEKRALRSLRLVEKVESLGLENIISTQSDAMNQLAHGIANRSSSPMAQIGNFKVINKNPEDLHFNREQIKEVLTKGLSTPQTTPTTSSICTSSLEQQQRQLQSAVNEQIVVAPSNSSAQNKSVAPPNVHLQRQRSRRNIKNGLSGQRPDLGTVGGRVRPDLGKVGHINSRADLLQNQHEEKHRDDTIQQQSMTQSFVGSISSLLFGRKGGWL